ncbi:MAG: HNH endonuclease [Elusimicrobia bacterium]|nr:HNH endonuclease [Elusimicrobiota bacterium]
MPDRDVKTVRDQIYFQYAKIIACSAFHCADGQEAKKKCYGFIKKTFRDLKNGNKLWSDIMREDWQFANSDKKCAYCGSTEDLEQEHLVPRSVNIKPECRSCEKILGIHNQVYACRRCNGPEGKWNKGLYVFYRDSHPGEKKFYDIIPPLAEKKYLKTIYSCHECAGTLDNCDLDGDGVMTVLDIDSILPS